MAHHGSAAFRPIVTDLVFGASADLIATFCLREQHSLLHRDRAFDPFERFLGLPVIHAGSAPSASIARRQRPTTDE
jgi:hypothetical protein